MKANPPLLAVKLLHLLLKPSMLEEVLGDLDENFYQMCREKSTFHAKLHYWYQTFHYLRPFAIKKIRSNSTTIHMFPHLVKIAYRSLFRYKTTLIINIVGLTTGVVCALFILLWINDEVNKDAFHPNSERLYQVVLHHEESDGIRTTYDTQALLAEALQDEVPEVELAIQDTDADWFKGSFALSSGKIFSKAIGKFSGNGFFKLFNYPIRYGIKNDVLNNKNAIAISEKLAVQLFGSVHDAVGKTVDWQLLQFKGEAEVTAVFYDIRPSSSRQFDFVLPFQVFREILGADIHWGNYNAFTYARLVPGTDIDFFNEKISSFVKQHNANTNVSPEFLSYEGLYLRGQFSNGKQTGGRIAYVQLFAVVAGFILLMACINFMNLSTARATQRMKEIGVKKSLGARRSSLILQFVTESVLLVLLATLLAVAFVVIFLPEFNVLSGKQISIQLTAITLTRLAVFVLLTGLLAGSYPALYLSGFKPLATLKGKLTTSFGEKWTRHGLVVFQFTLSFMMIIGMLIVQLQFRYIQSKNLGYNREGIIQLPLQGKTVGNLDRFLEQVRKVEGVKDATATSHPLVKEGGFTTGVSWQGKDPDVQINFGQARVNGHFIQTMGMELVDGRMFNATGIGEERTIIINETAAKVMGFDNAIGQKVIFWGNESEIIGVVKDFNFSSLHHEMRPIVLHYGNEYMTYAFIRISKENVSGSLESLNAFYKSFNPKYPFEYTFLDDNFEAQYLAEERVTTISKYFAGLAIIISLLGLFGLATFTAERRQKEIGIRMILGASSASIIQLLTGNFTQLVLVSIAIGVPLSYLITEVWLANYAYHVEVRWWLFAGVAVFSLVVALITAGAQGLRAIKMSPVKSLRTE